MNQTSNFQSVERAATRIIEVTGGQIVLAMPLGIGKPNHLVNALYQKALENKNISLQILTALSLSRPHGSSDLERRFMRPFVERIYGDYAELDYLADMRRNQLPENVSVHEFFVQPASELGHALAQQNYISTNYTHAARDLNARGVNVLAQCVARKNINGTHAYSLSCNPEVTLDLIPLLNKRRQQGETILTVAQVHNDLPFMRNDAVINASSFDMIIDDDDCHTTLFSTPNMPVGAAEHFIGMHASSLIADGGSLQIGIGALGDAVAGALLLRQENNCAYCQLKSDIAEAFPVALVAARIGGETPFQNGLYGCSEMFTFGLFELFRRGVIKRSVSANDSDICLHGGFFLGPNALYQGLRDLDVSEMEKISLTNISYVNHLYGDEKIKRQQRVAARFINTAFTMTLMGAGVADQLENGQVLSGVGGQYNFVAQAHELEDARSILLLRASRERGGELISNIVWNYGHTTIPRHLRDIVITEYGIADLRGKTDSEVIKSMLNITDSSFQQALMATAKKNLKLEASYQIPDAHSHNTTARLLNIYSQARDRDLFPNFPLGTDFTLTEQILLKALGWLKSKSAPRFMLELARKSMLDDDAARRFTPHLEHMALDQPRSLKERIYRQLILTALHETAEGDCSG